MDWGWEQRDKVEVVRWGERKLGGMTGMQRPLVADVKPRTLKIPWNV